jgi:hypothetical protein
MPGKLTPPETNDILKTLLKKINKYIKEDNSKKEIQNFLKSIEDNIIKFFRNNIDRRKEVREKPIMKDMLDFYKIKSSYL